jgi:hypothetical protein
MRRDHRVIGRDIVEREEDANDAQYVSWGEQIFKRMSAEECPMCTVKGGRITAKQTLCFTSEWGEGRRAAIGKAVPVQSPPRN